MKRILQRFAPKAWAGHQSMTDDQQAGWRYWLVVAAEGVNPDATDDEIGDWLDRMDTASEPLKGWQLPPSPPSPLGDALGRYYFAREIVVYRACYEFTNHNPLAVIDAFELWSESKPQDPMPAWLESALPTAHDKLLGKGWEKTPGAKTPHSQHDLFWEKYDAACEISLCITEGMNTTAALHHVADERCRPYETVRDWWYKSGYKKTPRKRRS